MINDGHGNIKETSQNITGFQGIDLETFCLDWINISVLVILNYIILLDGATGGTGKTNNILVAFIFFCVKLGLSPKGKGY